MGLSLNANFGKFGVPAGFRRSRAPLLGVDTQWFVWRNPVQQRRISSYKVSMYRTRALGLPVHVKARIVKSLFSVGLHGAEVGGMSEQRMKDLSAAARRAIGKGSTLRRSIALELMAHDRPKVLLGVPV
eukprot:194744-Amphidinium_carterae.1